MINKKKKLSYGKALPICHCSLLFLMLECSRSFQLTKEGETIPQIPGYKPIQTSKGISGQ